MALRQGPSRGREWNEVRGSMWPGGGLPLLITQEGTTKYITGPGGLPIEQVDRSGHAEYYLQDQLGSTRGLIDSSGNVVGEYTYDAWGNVQGRWGATTPFGYAEEYADAESGLQYLRTRYYDPSASSRVPEGITRITAMRSTDGPGSPTSWAIVPFASIGPLRFGTSRQEARSVLTAHFRVVKRYPPNEIDVYNSYGAHLYYDPAGSLEIVEVFAPCEPMYNGTLLLQPDALATVSQLEMLGNPAIGDGAGYDFRDIGVSLYAPGDETEGVTVFRQMPERKGRNKGRD